jgi:hypothetical protein
VYCAHREIAMSTTSSERPWGRELGMWDWDRIHRDGRYGRKAAKEWLQKSVDHALPQLFATIAWSLLCLVVDSKTRSERNTVESEL